MAGMLVPVFALRSKNDLGIGDTLSLINCIDFCARHNITILQVLPINETGPDNSPYNALSSQALDPVLLAMASDMVPGLTEAMVLAERESLSADFAHEASVNYPIVKKLKLNLLKKAYVAFVDSKNKALKDFATFKKNQQKWLDSYCLYRSLLVLNNDNMVWTDWDNIYQEVTTARQARDSYVKAHALTDDICLGDDFWAYVQFVAFEQWLKVYNHACAKNIKLIGDLPFGVSRYSCDVWANKDLFDLEWSCGAPPETYFQCDGFLQKWGQNWGMPLYNWTKQAKRKYAWWQSRVESIMTFFHGYRIDHVLGFYRVYSFPWLPKDNQEYLELSLEEVQVKTNGKIPQFLPYSDEDEAEAKLNEKQGVKILKKIIEFSPNAIIIAEDLGLVPDYVRPSLAKLGIAGFTIPQFERNKDYTYKDPQNYPEGNLATYGTHDHDPLALFYDGLVKWWHSDDGRVGWLEVQRLMQFLGWDINNPPYEFNDDLHQALLRRLFETRCQYAVLIISDILGTRQRFNQPGSNADSNWSQRLEMSLEDFEHHDYYQNKINFFHELIISSSRNESNVFSLQH